MAKKKIDLAFNVKELKDVNVIGKALVKKVIYENDKVQKLSLELYTATRNDKVARAWQTATLFLTDDRILEENDKITFKGYIASNEYKGKWTNDIIITEFDVLD